MDNGDDIAHNEPDGLEWDEFYARMTAVFGIDAVDRQLAALEKMLGEREQVPPAPSEVK